MDVTLACFVAIGATIYAGILCTLRTYAITFILIDMIEIIYVIVTIFYVVFVVDNIAGIFAGLVAVGVAGVWHCCRDYGQREVVIDDTTILVTIVTDITILVNTTNITILITITIFITNITTFVTINISITDITIFIPITIIII